MIDRLEKKQIESPAVSKVKKKKFMPIPKKHIRYLTCRFCGKTETRHYILDEISQCSWEGKVVSQLEYSETKALTSIPLMSTRMVLQISDG